MLPIATDDLGRGTIFLPMPGEHELLVTQFHAQSLVVDPQANALGAVLSHGRRRLVLGHSCRFGCRRQVMDHQSLTPTPLNAAEIEHLTKKLRRRIFAFLYKKGRLCDDDEDLDIEPSAHASCLAGAVQGRNQARPRDE